VVYVNNGGFGATGGQQAPTTLIGQPTTSYPAGRDPKESGYPLRMAEMLSVIAPESYIAACPSRCSAYPEKQEGDPQAFEVQMEGRGFGMVEILAACPTNWRMDPVRSIGKNQVRHDGLLSRRRVFGARRSRRFMTDEVRSAVEGYPRATSRSCLVGVGRPGAYRG